MNCQECGSHNPEDAVYCNKCGVKLEFHRAPYKMGRSSYRTGRIGLPQKKNIVIMAVSVALTAAAVVLMLFFTLEKRPDKINNIQKKTRDRESKTWGGDSHEPSKKGTDDSEYLRNAPLKGDPI